MFHFIRQKQLIGASLISLKILFENDHDGGNKNRNVFTHQGNFVFQAQVSLELLLEELLFLFLFLSFLFFF